MMHPILKFHAASFLSDIRFELEQVEEYNEDYEFINEIAEELLKNALNFIDLSEEIDENDDNLTIPVIRRCSSLKTCKTPPGNATCKKIVRFADALGLDLADVRTFLDEIPKIPNSAFNDLIITSCSSQA